MSQQINLVNSAFQKRSKAIYVSSMLQILALVTVALLSGSGYLHYQVSQRRAQADLTTMQLLALQERNKQLDLNYVPRTKSPRLAQELNQKEAEEKALQQVLLLLQKDAFGNRSGYSAYLIAFARQIREGVWLTGMTIAGAGTDISLQGRALRASLVPAYLDRLQTESILHGAVFASLGMQLPATRDSAGSAAKFIEFDLRSSSAVKKTATGSGGDYK